ncbi:MAG TPA: Fur family transcriptional regulator [Mariprofundaceae bacterium]|nr:Fur family transcriptional regulator [Mariprofundaceae bacterium]
MTAPISAFDIESMLRAHGLRITPQRMAVANLMLAEPTHMSPQKVYEVLHKGMPSLSPNTIYLTLDQFEKAGLLKRIFIDGKSIYDSKTERHDHACCRSCGAIKNLPASSVESIPLTLKRWKIEGESRVWSGICPDCMDPQAKS